MIKHLQSQDDFDCAEREGRLVGLFDKHTGDHLHLLRCAYVKRQHFYEKVVLNGGKNGRYEQYGSIEDVPDYLLDHPCPLCFKGISSLRALMSRPDFRQRLLEEQRKRAAVTPRVEAPESVEDQRSSVQPDPVVRWRGASGGTLECWCSRQLDLVRKPPDVRGVLRTLIQEHVPQLRSNAGQVLSATFIAPRLLHGSDVENVLFTNTDQVDSLFRAVAGRGVVFEFWPQDPGTKPGAVPLGCCSVYECVEPGQPSSRWADGQLLAEWGPIPVPSFKTATSCGPVWWDLRHGAMTVHLPPQIPQFFGVHLELHVPTGESTNSVARIKVAVDAAVLSLSCDDGAAPLGGTTQFAAKIGQPEPAVRALLMDRTRAVFGACRTLDARGQANPPDSGCVQGSLLVAPGRGTGWAISGRILALKPKST